METVFIRQDESIVHESLETGLQDVLCFFGLGFGVRGKGGFRGVVVEVGGFDVLSLLGAKDGGLYSVSMILKPLMAFLSYLKKII